MRASQAFGEDAALTISGPRMLCITPCGSYHLTKLHDDYAQGCSPIVNIVLHSHVLREVFPMMDDIIVASREHSIAHINKLMRRPFFFLVISRAPCFLLLDDVDPEREI